MNENKGEGLGEGQGEEDRGSAGDSDSSYYLGSPVRLEAGEEAEVAPASQRFRALK